jgi:hypothetical protein
MRIGCTAVLALVLSSAAATAITPEQDERARALIGLEYRLAPGVTNGQVIAEHPTCTHLGGAVMWMNGRSVDDWGFSQLLCNGHPIIALEHKVHSVDPNPKWRVVDAQSLPPYERNADEGRPHALRLHFTGECALDGRTDTLFFVLLRWGKRERVDWRTGIERAWGFNLDAERIVPLSTRRIVCEKPDPLD